MEHNDVQARRHICACTIIIHVQACSHRSHLSHTRKPPYTRPLPTPMPATLHLHPEHQLLCHLPHTGTIVFTIRMYLVPMPARACKLGMPVWLMAVVHGVKSPVWTCIVLSFVLLCWGLTITSVDTIITIVNRCLSAMVSCTLKLS